MRIAVDLDGRARLRHRIEHLLDATGERIAPQDQPPERVPPDLEHRLAHRVHQPPRHRRFVHLHARVNAGDDHVHLLEDGIGIVERAVFEDVALGPAQEAHLDALLHARDLVPLPLEPIERHAAGVVRRR